MMAYGADKTGERANIERISPYLWLLFFICFLGNALGGITSTLMSVYLPDVVRDLNGLGPEPQLNKISAFISALFFVGWAIGGLIWGRIGDYIGRAGSLALSIGMFGLFTFLTALAPSWKAVVVFRFFCGFGVGGMMVMNTTLVSEVWPGRTRAIFIGIMSIEFPVGIISSGAINYLIPAWRDGFMTGLLPLGIGISSRWILKESEQWKAGLVPNEAGRHITYIRHHRRDLINGSIIFGSMLIGLWAVFSWVPTWIQSLLSLTDGQRERGLSMMLMGAGGLTGGFLSGWIANALGTRKVMLLVFSGCFILSVLIFKLNTVFSTLILVEITVLTFMFGISQGLLGVYIPLLFPVAIRATSTGFCFNIGRFFTSAAVFFLGVLVTSLGGYGNSLLTFSFIFLLGFLMLLFSRNITSE